MLFGGFSSVCLHTIVMYILNDTHVGIYFVKMIYMERPSFDDSVFKNVSGAKCGH